MAKPKKPQPIEQDPNDDPTVDAPEAPPVPPEEDPTSQPDGYMGGV